MDGSGVIKNDDLSQESNSFSRWVSFRVRGNISSFKFFDGNVFNIETNIVSWNSFGELFVMHFNRFDHSGFISRGKVTFHIGFKDTGFNSSDGDCSNSSNFVNILERKSEGFFCGSFGGVNLIKSFEESWSFVPGSVG